MKKLASLFLTVLFCLGLGFCFTACQETPSTPNENNAYKITVVDASVNPVAGVRVQLCDPATGTCLTDDFITDTNGKVSCKVAQKVYDIHVQTADGLNEYDIVGVSQTPATYAEITVTVVLS